MGSPFSVVTAPLYMGAGGQACRFAGVRACFPVLRAPVFHLTSAPPKNRL
jgi:hypothetical protein